MDATVAPPPSPPPSRRRVGGLAAAALIVALVVALVVALAAAPLLLLRSAAGTAWLLARVPGLAVTAPEGALLGPRFAAERLRWTGTAGTLEIDGLVLAGSRWHWRPAPGAWAGLDMDSASASGLAWQPGPSETPATRPASLRLPLVLNAPLRVGRLEIGTLAPLLDATATLRLGAEDGAAHHVEGLRLHGAGVALAGDLRLAADAPNALRATLRAASREGAAQPWQADATAEGDLDAFALQARLRGRETGSDTRTDGAALDIEARIAPFAPWPLLALQGRTQALDLSRLIAGWPQTRLDGEAALQGSARDAPFAATLALRNALPGRWNEGRLPVREATLRLGARLDARDRVTIEALLLQLADSSADAGRVSGSGRWQGHGLALALRLDGVTPQRLDGRAAAMSLAGEVTLDAQGLPAPDGGAAPAPWSLSAQSRLEGRAQVGPGAARSVTLQWEAQASADAVELRSLRARSGAAEAQASARAERRSGPLGARWALRSSGRLADFDPAPWWPGAEGSAWRRGPHRLNAEWTLDLLLPPAGDWRQTGGDARLLIAPSQLAGLPLEGEFRLEGARRASARLALAGNTLQAEGEGRADGDGRDDRWTLDLQAPALDRLAPLATLHPALADLMPRAGSAEAQMQWRGRWPAIEGRGSARVQGLRSAALAIDALNADAALGADGRLDLRLGGDALAWRGQRVTRLDARLDGSLAAHRLQVDAALPLLPPAALEHSFGLAPAKGTWLALRGEGGWQREAAGSRWRGRLERLSAGGWNGALPLAGEPPQDWLHTDALRAELGFDTGGALVAARADPGRVRVGGALALAWDEVRLADGAWQLQAALESFAVAPLLARWQPELGWEGDLRVGARIDVRAGARFDADIVLEREGGDLQVRDGAGTPLPLGLTDLRLALQAHDGTWTFTQALAGRTLGELGGALRVQTAPERRWPEPSAPMDGSVQARVANLGVWGAWVPPGWRLEGSMQTQARFGGRFGAPELRGELSGSGLGARNLLQGVQVGGGELRVRLDGERAVIERFTLAAGSGTLSLEGEADLGAAPQARLALVAERFQVLGRVDRRVVASGRADLALRPDALVLRGRFGIDEGLFDASRGGAPALDDDVVVRSGPAPAATDAPAVRARPQRRIDVALEVDLGERLRVRGRGLDTRLAGTLAISAPGGRLAVQGTVSARDGSYAAYGQKLEIRRGLVAFSGAADNPRLDVLALRPNLDIEVGVAITGTAQAPRIRLHSDPEMADTDKLSWLVLGRDPAGLGRTDTALLQRAALGLLAGEGEGPTDALIRNLGLDEVSVRQTDGDTRETIVTVGKQLSQRWFVAYERGVNATVGTWQLIYRAARRFTLRAQSGAENSLDVIWTWRVP